MYIYNVYIIYNKVYIIYIIYIVYMPYAQKQAWTVVPKGKKAKFSLCHSSTWGLHFCGIQYVLPSYARVCTAHAVRVCGPWFLRSIHPNMRLGQFLFFLPIFALPGWQWLVPLRMLRGLLRAWRMKENKPAWRYGFHDLTEFQTHFWTVESLKKQG